MHEAGEAFAEFAKRGASAMDKGKQFARGLLFAMLWWVLFYVCLGFGFSVLTVGPGAAALLCTWHALGAAVEIYQLLRGPKPQPRLPRLHGDVEEANDDELRDRGLMR